MSGGETAPTPASSAPAERWRNLSPEALSEYRAAASAVHDGLDRDAVLDVGVVVCEAMFEIRTDEQIVGTAQRSARERLDVELSAGQAARLIPLTNDHLCPDLLR